MSRYILSASAIASATTQIAVLVVSVTDTNGAPQTGLKKKSFQVSNLVFGTKNYGLVGLVLDDFYEEPFAFYTMTLKADPRAKLSSAVYKGSPLAISVRKISLGAVASGAPGVLAEGHLTISATGP